MDETVKQKQPQRQDQQPPEASAARVQPPPEQPQASEVAVQSPLERPQASTQPAQSPLERPQASAQPARSPAGQPQASAQDAQSVARGAEALLRENPEALVCGLASNGLIVPVPQTVGLWGQGLIEGRALIDNVVADDRTAVVRTWIAAQQDGAATAKVRMLNNPTSWANLHFLDVREVHGVVLGVIIPSDERADVATPAPEAGPAAPRFCTLSEDEGARVLAADAAFTQMFGYTEEELLGQSVLDQIHPDDQGRAVEGWLAVLSTRRAQQTRLRRVRKDGTWMWVDTTLHNHLSDPERNCVMVEMIDISAEMAAQEALHEHEELLRRLTDAMPVGLLQIDTERDVVYNNARLLDILYGSPDAAGMPEHVEASEPKVTPMTAAEAAAPLEDLPVASAMTLLKALTPESAASFESVLDEVLGEGADRDVEVDIELPSGAWRRALMSLRALSRTTGEVSGAITCVLDITDSARARQELEHRATFDTLTQVYNRASILSLLQRELEREDSRTGAVYVDLDKFKPVNDTLGHAAGDELLVLVAERLKMASRDSDVIGRLGGDEFLIVLRDLPSAEKAMQVADRISMTLCGNFELSCGEADLRVSIGVACAEGIELGAEELVKRADAAMYESKSRGTCTPVLAALL
jgi:diguanylate cyclase (GGDEF)-like protein/PAS domain S-box-containing protein